MTCFAESEGSANTYTKEENNALVDVRLKELVNLADSEKDFWDIVHRISARKQQHGNKIRSDSCSTILRSLFEKEMMMMRIQTITTKKSKTISIIPSQKRKYCVLAEDLKKKQNTTTTTNSNKNKTPSKHKQKANRLKTKIKHPKTNQTKNKQAKTKTKQNKTKQNKQTNKPKVKRSVTIQLSVKCYIDKGTVIWLCNKNIFFNAPFNKIIFPEIWTLYSVAFMARRMMIRIQTITDISIDYVRNKLYSCFINKRL